MASLLDRVEDIMSGHMVNPFLSGEREVDTCQA